MLKIISSAFDFLKSIAGALGSIFGFLKQRDSEVNSPEIKANKEAEQNQQVKDKTVEDLKNNNEKELEKDLSN